MHFLITAGGTREYIDPVRFITNASSGKMGVALARAALKAGHQATLISAPIAQRLPEEIEGISVQTAHDMLLAVQDRFLSCDVLIMAAAVSDYTIVNPSPVKLKKTQKTLTLQLEPTVDILQWAGAEKLRRERRKGDRRQRVETGGQRIEERRRRNQGHGPFVVGFALEDEDLHQRAEAKLIDKHLDLIIANHSTAIGADGAAIHIKAPDRDWQEFPTASKTTQARRIIQTIEDMLS